MDTLNDSHDEATAGSAPASPHTPGARLIAAAPDLYAALKALVALSGCVCGDFGVGMGEDHTDACKVATAALAKAEGR